MPNSGVDGIGLDPPPPDSDVGRLIYLIEWARKRGVRIGPTVQIGDLVLQVTDLRQTEHQRSSEPNDPGWLAAHGHEG